MLGVINIKIFKGYFYSCTLEDVITAQECIDMGGDWVNQVISFDNIFSALALVFRMVTSEGETLT